MTGCAGRCRPRPPSVRRFSSTRCWARRRRSGDRGGAARPVPPERAEGRRPTGVALALAGGFALAAGGFLGGHLSYRRAAGVNRVASAADPEDWVDLVGDLPDAPDRATCGTVDGTPVAIFMVDGTPQALADHCSHLGGPLHEGDVAGGCVRCPWHGSTFRIADGAVTTGPATATQPAYEIRRTGGRLLARRKPMP